MPLLSCRFLLSVRDVNTFGYSERAYLTQGDQAQVYLQLVDQNLDGPDSGSSPVYRRYCPAPGSTLRVTLRNLDQAAQAYKAATQPFPGDASIWSFPVYASDQLRGTVVLQLDLFEGGSHTYGVVQPAISVRAKGV